MRPTPLPLAHGPTPLEPLDRLSDWLGGPRLLVKRDDQTGLALGGNKARKLEHLCAEALAQGCDTLVTGGGPQSNHCRMTAAAANRLGLKCHLALALGGRGVSPRQGRREPPQAAVSGPPTGNLLLDHLLGAELHPTKAREYYEIEASIEAVAEEVRAAGGRPYAIPVGGASVTGALGYLDAARELTGQLAEPLDWIVVADGSGGTHAGLLAGQEGSTRILGIDVGTRPDLDQRVPELAAATAAAVDHPASFGEIHIDHTRFGAGYGKPTPECLEAIRAAARLEGLILDPVYTGKAMAGLIGWIREGRFTEHQSVLFWHTGGAPALFADGFSEWLTA
ncbi:MAG TPA: D-cysteine desulfhydrase family protein [Acidimicrobiia bacterium]|nr:D-cysteine desulfhydrase family protein [Acidimicrobiia bacterium]